MERIIVFGNSGSGKSTLAKALAKLHEAEHLDLDTIAWEAKRPGVRADFEESRRALAVHRAVGELGHRRLLFRVIEGRSTLLYGDDLSESRYRGMRVELQGASL